MKKEMLVMQNQKQSLSTWSGSELKFTKISHKVNNLADDFLAGI